ncbi:hypothetical protein Pyn_40688 [Prunus yedoensis var. nudiflora]|uniref:Uncharacterized protein n=1 Tax=Prunus yedoensis var. nudiflora TaxID=2094558 RepID=A0A314YTT2_PRUYE|nr:hypothetical protein Pyn_40688 [Prunus yedoensis var. nudiflora]
MKFGALPAARETGKPGRRESQKTGVNPSLLALAPCKPSLRRRRNGNSTDSSINPRENKENAYLVNPPREDLGRTEKSEEIRGLEKGGAHGEGPSGDDERVSSNGGGWRSRLRLDLSPSNRRWAVLA